MRLNNLILFLVLFSFFSHHGQIRTDVDYKTETEYSFIKLRFKNDSTFEMFDQPKIGGLVGQRKGKYHLEDNQLILKYDKEFAKPDSIESIRIERKKTQRQFMKFDFDIRSNFDESKKYYGTDLVIHLDIYRIVWFFGGHDDIESDNKDLPLTVKLRDTIKLDTILSKGYDYNINIVMKEKFEIQEIYNIEIKEKSQLILMNQRGERFIYFLHHK